MDSKKYLRQVEYQCPYYKIVKEQVLLPNGKFAIHFTQVSPNPFVIVLAFQEDKLVCIKQWRPTIKQWNWELVAGAIDDKETAEQAAQRELREETGYETKSINIVGEFWLAVGHTNQKGIVCLASNVQKTGEQQLSGSEIIEIELKTLLEIDTMIENGELIDGPSLTALMIYKTKNRE